MREFYEYSTEHSIPLLGFKPDRTYDIQVTATAVNGAAVTAAPGTERDDRRSAGPVPACPNTGEPADENGARATHSSIFETAAEERRGGPAHTMMVDALGDVVWYSLINPGDIRMLPSTDLFYTFGGDETIHVTNLLGEDLRIWQASLSGDTPADGAIPVNAENFHHEAFPTEHGTIITTVHRDRMVANYPTSETDPDAPTETVTAIDDPIIEFDWETGAIINEWSLMDVLDPTRIGYLSVGVNRRNDWAHINAVIHDPRDDTVITSLRHQDSVVKFRRSDGSVVWALGPPENWKAQYQQHLLTPVGTPFAWQYHQHAPMVTPQGLMMFDNGNFRNSPFNGPVVEDVDNASRAVEFYIDEANMEISQLWEFHGTNGDEHYARFICDADWPRLQTKCFGHVWRHHLYEPRGHER